MSARDELAELIAKAIEDTYHGFASACGDEVTISVTMQGEDSVSVDCDKVADAILAAGWRAPLPNRWTCGHERRPGNWGINGECIRCAMVGQQISATIEAMET